MFLKQLQILNGTEVLREILFKKGINLIVDETSTVNKTSSGNGVGKTTVLRLIDFCLAGDGKNIYTDPEFKKPNRVVENFIKNNNVLIKLVLVEDLANPLGEQFVIERNFLPRKNKIQRINTVDYGNKEFERKLKELIFKTESEQPTFKQLKSKNIRDEKNKLINTIKVLTPNVVTDVTYEILHLYWFGIDTNFSKDKLVRELNVEKRIQSRLWKESNLAQIQQALIIVNRQIEEFVRQKNTFNVNDDFEADFNAINDVRQKINRMSTEISRLELRRELISESKHDLELSRADVNLEQIKALYSKARAFIPDLQKTFEDTLNFHNGMIENKLRFITKELPELEHQLVSDKNEMSRFLQKEKQLSEKLHKSDAIDELQKIIENLNEFYEKKGHLEEQKRNWEISNANIQSIIDQLTWINSELQSKDELITYFPRIGVAEFFDFPGVVLKTAA